MSVRLVVMACFLAGLVLLYCRLGLVGYLVPGFLVEFGTVLLDASKLLDDLLYGRRRGSTIGRQTLPRSPLTNGKPPYVRGFFHSVTLHEPEESVPTGVWKN